MHITTDALVLKEHKIDDESRMVCLLTKDRGIVYAYIRGAKRLRGKLTSSTQLFCYSRFVLFKSRSRYTVDSADINALFFELTQDIETFTLVSYMAQLMAETAPEEEPAEDYLRLMLNCLYLLKEKKRTAAFIKPLFELRLLSMSGYMPDLTACDSCGEYEAEKMFFQPVHGTMICGKCFEAEHEQGSVPLSLGVLSAMRHIIYAPIDRLFSFTISDETLRNLGIISENYLLNQLGKDFKALEMYRSLLR